MSSQLRAAIVLVFATAAGGCSRAGEYRPPAGSYTARAVTLNDDTIPAIVADVDSTFVGPTPALLGRLFIRDEYASGARVALLSHAGWSERFGSRPDVIGTTLRIDGAEHTIVGILPPGVDEPAGVAAWVPRGSALRLVRGGTPVEDERAVRAVVQRFFDGMRTRDIDGLRATMLPGAVLVNPIRRDTTITVRTLTVDQLAGMVADTPEPYDERMPQAEVRIDTDMATVWGRYTFRVGDRITNCGRNSFQLLRTDDGWKIAHIGSTIETTGCG